MERPSRLRDLVEVNLRFQRELAKVAFDFAATATRLGLEAKQGAIDVWRGTREDGWAATPAAEPDPPAKAATAPAMVLSGESGQIARCMFAVDNTLPTPVRSLISATAAISESGAVLAQPLSFSPNVVHLGPGEQAVCTVEVAITDDLPAEVSYRAMISAGVEGTQIPVIVRRVLPPATLPSKPAT